MYDDEDVVDALRTAKSFGVGSRLGTKWTTPEQDAAARQRFVDAEHKPTLIGKTLGAVGFDESGQRAATPWHDAFLSTLHMPWRFADAARDAATVARDVLQGKHPLDTPIYSEDDAPPPSYVSQVNPDILGRGLNFAGTIASAAPGAAVAGAVPSNTAGMFAGRLARTADHAALAKAEKMAAEGLPREQIWNDTGWFQGKDGKWRFEIDDSAARWNPDIAKAGLDVGAAIEGYRGGFGRSPKMNDLFDHPAFYDAYPGSEKLGVEAIKDLSARGSYDNAGMVRLNTLLTDDNAIKSTNLHELQHAVQQREDFARGYNPIEAAKDIAQARFREQELRDKTQRWQNAHSDEALVYETRARNGDPEATEIVNASQRWVDKLGAKSDDNPYGITPVEAIAAELGERDAILQRGIREYNDVFRTARLSPDELYKMNAGETEARTVQKRMDLTAEERRTRPPWLDYDIPESQQIVRLSSNPDDIKASIPGTILSGAGDQSATSNSVFKGYRGAVYNKKPFGQWWASSDPDVASLYAQMRSKDNMNHSGAIAAEMQMRPTMIIDGKELRLPPHSYESDAALALKYTNGDYDRAIREITGESSPLAPIIKEWKQKGAKLGDGKLDDASATAKGVSDGEGYAERIIPSEFRFFNPMVIDADGANWSKISHNGRTISTDGAVDLARRAGHDGVVIRNVVDDPAPGYSTGRLQDTIAAIKPGTVYSPLSGDLLFANSRQSSLPGTLIRSAVDDDVAHALRVARSLDPLGYYSQALEAAKGLKQEKGTGEQFRAQLKNAGVKDAEIAATGLDKLLADKSITKSDIVKHLEGNRVGLREVVRSGETNAKGTPFENEFITFPITDKIREAVKAGQPLFSNARPSGVPGTMIRDASTRADVDATLPRAIRASAEDSAVSDALKVARDIAKERDSRPGPGASDPKAAAMGALAEEPSDAGRATDNVLNTKASSDGSDKVLSNGLAVSRSLQFGDFEAMLDRLGVPYQKQNSNSISEVYGPSLSIYYKVSTPDGIKEFRVSDHEYAPRQRDFRLGQSAAAAEQKVRSELGLEIPDGLVQKSKEDADVMSAAADERRRQRAEESRAAARYVSPEKQRERANTKLLNDAGFGHLRGQERKDAIRKLKGIESSIDRALSTASKYDPD